MANPAQLSSFALLEPIGSGGMGVVYKAQHVDYAVHVAIKVLTTDAATRARTDEIFRNEIRAIARLDHPCIPRVFDAGQIPASVEAATEGVLIAGNPWLAMEFADGGTLDEGRGPKDWPGLRALLLQLLDALAHAHARGVLHRDIKPTNLLWSGASGILLADFGLADLRLRGGTPGFAAPEQLTGGPQGPWTDNHALGVTALQLAGKLAVPPDFDAWAARMCDPEPGLRFQTAAEAARHLMHLDGEATEFLNAVVADESNALTIVRGVHTPALGAVARPHDASTLPEHWEVERTPRPLHLQGTGMGLLELREPRTVGRIPARDALWAALRQVERTGVGAVHVLEGPAGSGRSHLATWLQHRARELGTRVEVRQIGFATEPPSVETLVLKIVRHAAYEAPGALVLDPLHDDETSALIRELLGFNAALTGWIVHASAGHPAAVVCLVRQLAAEPSLILTPTGFSLALEMPPVLEAASVEERWPSPPVPIHAAGIHLLAAMGTQGDLIRWRAGLIELDQAEPDLTPLVEAGMLQLIEERWRFTDPFACEAVLASLPSLLRPRIHAVAAAALETGPLAALAHLRAGQREAALACLLDCLEGIPTGLTAWLVSRGERWLEALGVPAEDPRWGHIWLAQAKLHGMRQEGAEQLAKRVLAEGRRHQWGPLLATAAHQLAKDYEQRGNLPEARDLMEKAREAFQRMGDRPQWVVCTVQLADLHGALGRPDAVALLDEVLVDVEASWRPWVLLCKARLLSHTPEAAIRVARESQRLLEDFPRSESNLAIRANTLSAEGDAHRKLANPTEAGRCFRRAHTLYTAAGRSADATTCVVNLAILELQAGHYGEARDALSEHTKAAARSKHLRAAISLLLATAEAGRGELEAHDRHFAEAAYGLAESGFVDADLAEMAELAARLTSGDRAQRCLALAKHQRARLGSTT